MEDLARNGYLNNYIDHEIMAARQRVKNRQVNVIARGATLAGDSNRSRKSYSRTQGTEVLKTERTPTPRGSRSTPIMFTDEDAQGVSFPHDDALIIKATIGGTEVDRILVDPGSAVDIIFKEALESLGVEYTTLTNDSTPYMVSGVQRSSY